MCHLKEVLLLFLVSLLSSVVKGNCDDLYAKDMNLRERNNFPFKYTIDFSLHPLSLLPFQPPKRVRFISTRLCSTLIRSIVSFKRQTFVRMRISTTSCTLCKFSWLMWNLPWWASRERTWMCVKRSFRCGIIWGHCNHNGSNHSYSN